MGLKLFGKHEQTPEIINEDEKNLSPEKKEQIRKKEDRLSRYLNRDKNKSFEKQDEKQDEKIEK